VIIHIDHLFFWEKEDWLSNFYPCDFWVLDATKNINAFFSSEQFFMYQKAAYFRDMETMAKILITPSPAEAKKLGKGVRGFDEDIWDVIGLLAMHRALKAKFSLPDLKEKLLATADLKLVEASPYDLKWGIGYNQVDACHHLDQIALRRGAPPWGQNRLGKCLMALRWELRRGE
jgi:ribA/ribD-fused uncharacterized protein